MIYNSFFFTIASYICNILKQRCLRNFEEFLL